MGRRTLPLVLVLVFAVLLAGAGYVGWKYVQQRHTHACAACLRPVHANTRTVAKVGAKSASYCCPACALSVHQQSRVPVEVVELTDHETGARLRPEEAFLVRGSDVNSCARHMEALIQQDKRPMEAHYDRCAPSLLAFSRRDSAAAFIREHGGQILRYENVAAMFR